MLIDRVVVNSSPLISLFRAELDGLLPQLFSKVFVPDAVWEEITVAGKDDMASTGIKSAKWIDRVSSDIFDPVVLGWGLGLGESAVLSYARVCTVDRVVIDDAAARRCAITLGMKCLGTGGILILAKKRGLLSSVRDAIGQLQDAGLWLGDNLFELLLTMAGE